MRSCTALPGTHVDRKSVDKARRLAGGRTPKGCPTMAFTLFPADSPDHPRAGNLHEWPIALDLELTVGIGLAEVAHRAVIHQVEGAVGAELPVHGAVDPVNLGDECLLEGLVVGEPRECERERLAQRTEVHELHVMTLL